jgi:quercetin dioxygenase-like cupin family protein
MTQRGFVLFAVISLLGVSAADPIVPPAKVLSSTALSWEEIQAGPGRGKQVFRHATATLDELELHVSTLAPGKEAHPPHKHPDEEVIIVKEGTVESLVNGQTRRLGPGAVIFQAANQLHTIRNVGEVPAVYHVMKWNSPGMLKARAEKKP